MIGTNHFLSGAVIGLSVSQPVLALPLAFLSHFVLDMVPHFGFEGWGDNALKRKYFVFWTVVKLDIIFLTIALIFLAMNREWLAIGAGVIAVSPDFSWIYRFIYKQNFGRLPIPPRNKYDSFHKRIQWYEKLPGAIPEGLVLVLLSVMIWRMI
ncbi:MAG: hypothetical protein M3Q14_04735 [bacterium]|nr:hypothetical protein [bacterium]